MGSFTDRDQVVGHHVFFKNARFEIKRGDWTIEVAEERLPDNQRQWTWKILEGKVLRDSGVTFGSYDAQMRITESLKKMTPLAPLLTAKLRSRPSEIDIQETLQALAPAPSNELIEYQVDMGYSAMGARPIDGMWIKRGADGVYEARMPISIMGMGGGPGSPFSDRYDGNYASGRGVNRAVAIKLAIIDAAWIAASLWE